MLGKIKREIAGLGALLDAAAEEIVLPAVEEVVRDTAACILESSPTAIAVQYLEGPDGRRRWYAWFAEHPEDGGVDVNALDVFTMGRPRLAARKLAAAARRVRKAAALGFWAGCFGLAEVEASRQGYVHGACDDGCAYCERTEPFRARAEAAHDALRAEHS